MLGKFFSDVPVDMGQKAFILIPCERFFLTNKYCSFTILLQYFTTTFLKVAHSSHKRHILYEFYDLRLPRQNKIACFNQNCEYAMFD